MGGSFFPSQPITDMQRPSTGYQYLIQSLVQGGGKTKSFGTAIYRYSYCVSIGAVAQSDTTFVIPANGVRPAPTGIPATANGSTVELNSNIATWPNSLYCGYDLEKSSGLLFSGLNTRDSPPFCNLFFATATPANTPVNLNA